MKTAKVDDLVDFFLRDANEDVSKKFSADVVFFRSPLRLGVDDLVRKYIEEIRDSCTENSEPPKDKLCVLIETDGGYIEVVERIYSVFRRHYNEVIFVVPSFAYSAGTVLVLSGDEIYMDYYSVLGPIDPQIESDGQFVPGIGYLHKYNELVETINKDQNGSETRAELAYLIKKFDPAKLFHIEQARAHSITLIEEWLPKHKFKNWTITADNKLPVTDAYKKERANKIAEILGEPKKWHSHGRGIGIRELQMDEIKLIVNNFGDTPDLNEAIRKYYDLLIDYLGKIGIENAIHGVCGLRRI